MAKGTISGKLVLAGAIDAEIVRHFGELLQSDNVIAPRHIVDINAAYQSADVFVSPSLEEGGPKVTYEAMASDLPVIVSPMSAGAIARDGEDGYVLDPYDQDAWTAAMCTLANDTLLRRRMSQTAMERAQHFTWDKVGKRRTDVLFEVLNGKSSDARA